MKKVIIVIAIILSGTSGLLHSSPKLSDLDQENTHFSFDFSDTRGEWKSGFSDYLVATEIAAEHDIEENAVFLTKEGEVLSGMKLHSLNLSSETTMYAYRELDELDPNKTFQVEIKVEFATNVGNTCMGIGAAPGDVLIKAGVTQFEPEQALDHETYIRTNLDLGTLSQNGKHSMTLGTFGSDEMGECDPSSLAFKQKQLNSSTQYFEVTTNEEGKLWLTIATDSGFNGPTTLYLMSVELKLSPSNKPNPILT